MGCYIPPGSSLYRPTTTTYDALGRTLVVTAPDLSTTTSSYSMVGGLPSVFSVDAENHAVISIQDAWGRLGQVIEYREGTGSEGPYVPYATTNYFYTRSDQLEQVQDHLGNVTSPDMGSWSYAYSPNGVLTSQTDGENRVTILNYDSLDRLTEKLFPSGSPSRVTFAYDETFTPTSHGIGRKTSQCSYDGPSCTVYQRWEYDGRGRAKLAVQTTSTGTFSVGSSYDLCSIWRAGWFVVYR